MNDETRKLLEGHVESLETMIDRKRDELMNELKYVEQLRSQIADWQRQVAQFRDDLQAERHDGGLHEVDE